MIKIYFEITLGKGIGRIHKHSQRNWPYPSPNIISFLLQCNDPYIQTQLTSACDASVGTHALASAVSYKITIHHVNNDFNDNYDSRSFEIPRKNNCSSTYFGDTITKTATSNLSKLPPTGK